MKDISSLKDLPHYPVMLKQVLTACSKFGRDSQPTGIAFAKGAKSMLKTRFFKKRFLKNVFEKRFLKNVFFKQNVVY